SLAVPVPPNGSKRYCGLQASGPSNQRRIFLTVRFLVDRLRDFVQGDQIDLEVLTLTKGGQLFTRLATELEVAEPSLRGVTALALSATLSRISENVHQYRQLIATATGDLTIKTRLLELCEDLHTLEIGILAIKQKKSELKEEEKQRLTDASQSRADHVVGVMMTGLSQQQQKRIRTSEVSSEVDPNGEVDLCSPENDTRVEQIELGETDHFTDQSTTFESNTMEQDDRP
ncbi:hypothetical protein BGZ83_004994, partial [Gryganskiella cystojenkinii]